MFTFFGGKCTNAVICTKIMTSFRSIIPQLFNCSEVFWLVPQFHFTTSSVHSLSLGSGEIGWLTVICFDYLFMVKFYENILFCFNFVDNLYKDLTRQQIDTKIWSFHVNDLKIWLNNLYNLYRSSFYKVL